MQDGMIVTEEDFKDLESFMLTEIASFKNNKDSALQYLISTGMYDEFGNLKEEFCEISQDGSSS